MMYPPGDRDYRLYPPQYGDPFYRGRGRGRGRGGRGRREWLKERQIERPNRGFVRGNGRDYTVRSQQVSTDRPPPARQEDEWSLPPTVERRDDAEIQQTAQTSSPAAPPPTEERLFTDWSSEGSPKERSNQQIQLARSVESRRTEQAVREPEDDEVLRHVLSDVPTTLSAQVRIDQVGTRLVDRETNTSEVEARPPREEVRTDIIWVHSKGIQVPSSSSDFSSPHMNIEESMARPGIPVIMPQLDGPASVHIKRRQPVPMVRRRTTLPGGGYPDESDSVTLWVIDHMRIEDILEDENITRKEVGDHQIGDIQKEEDPLIMEGPLMMEDPQEMEDCREDLGDKDHQAPRTSWASTPNNNTTTTGYFRYNRAGKYIWNSWSVNVAIG